jgi:hypothetical protein
MILRLPLDGTLFFSGEVSGGGYYCDSADFWCTSFAILAREISAPALMADATTTTHAPFGLLLGLGLNDPWV